jgi:hypothetical protein
MDCPDPYKKLLIRIWEARKLTDPKDRIKTGIFRNKVIETKNQRKQRINLMRNNKKTYEF